jgi:hypothetical protein
MRQRALPDHIDLGDEPPLSADGVAPARVDRRRVSLRWYSGTILSGLFGAALMGGAVYIALDGEAIFAATPERVETTRSASASPERQAPALRKTDKLQTVSEGPTARQVLRVPVSAQIGERETVRVKPFVRIATNLALSVSDISSNINAPSRVAPAPAPATPAPADDPPPADDDLAITIRELTPLLGRIRIAATVTAEEILSRVRDAASWGGGTASGTVMAGAPANGAAMAYAPTETSADPYAGLGIRVVPENITLLAKTGTLATGGTMWNEKTIIAKKGDSITALLRELGATDAEAQAIAAALGSRGREGGLKDQQKIRVLLSPIARSTRLQPIRVIVMGENAPEQVVAFSDIGKYVAVDVQSADTTQVARTSKDDDDEEDENANGVRLQQSIYETALRQQVPKPLIDAFIRVYATDVNFQRKVQPGDSLELLYPGEDEAGGDAKPELLYASLTVGGETRRYYRFQAPDDNIVDYYDEGGKSAKKFLVLAAPSDPRLFEDAHGC